MRIQPLNFSSYQANPTFSANKPKFGCGICAATGGAVAAGVASAAATGITEGQAVTAGGIGTALGGLSAFMAKLSLSNIAEPFTATTMAAGAGILAAIGATLGVLKLSS